MLDISTVLLTILLGPALVSGNAYAPKKTDCPSTPLVRNANGLSDKEASYINSRNSKAAAALQAWLQNAAPSIKASQSNYPVLGLTTSGGGLRSLLTGAGVHQAFDLYDSDVSTSGLYQALTYESGLSGGAWLLSSVASNNWPTVSSLQSNLWNQAFEDTISSPPHFLKVEGEIGAALLSKHYRGFPIGVTDIYGRLLGYQLLYGKDGGVDHFLSDMTSYTNFTSHNVPYPIITALNTPPGSFLPHFKGKQMEFHPYEFGSWDAGIAAFTPTEYLGSSLSNGKPATSGQCFTGYDSQSFVLGTSSSVFSNFVAEGAERAPQILQLVAALKQLGLPTKSNDIYFAQYPNPFYNYSHSCAVQDQQQLNLVDGGVDHPDQGDPIWPMLHRDVDVLFVSANSADTIKNFPSGEEIHNTYIRAQQAGLSRMPEIPEADVFSSQSLNNKTTVFGCDDDSVMTIIYMPNRKISFNSGTSTLDLKYTSSQTAAMIKNGMQIATENGDQEFGMCLGCAIMQKVTGASLPNACNACLRQLCFKSSGNSSRKIRRSSSSGDGCASVSASGSGSDRGSGSGGSQGDNGGSGARSAMGGGFKPLLACSLILCTLYFLL